MVETTIEVEGMKCGMCESHVNDVIRKAFEVKKVTSSHAKNLTTVLSEQPLDEQALRSAIAAQGYGVGAITSEQVFKKGLFGRYKK